MTSEEAQAQARELFPEEIDQAEDPTTSDDALLELGQRFVRLSVLQSAATEVLLILLSNPNLSITSMASLLRQITETDLWSIRTFERAQAAVWSNAALPLYALSGQPLKDLYTAALAQATLQLLHLAFQGGKSGYLKRMSGLVSAGIRAAGMEDRLPPYLLTTMVVRTQRVYKLSREIDQHAKAVASGLRQNFFLPGSEEPSFVLFVNLVGARLHGSDEGSITQLVERVDRTVELLRILEPKLKGEVDLPFRAYAEG